MRPTASSCGQSRPPNRTSSPGSTRRWLVTVTRTPLTRGRQNLSCVPDLITGGATGRKGALASKISNRHVCALRSLIDSTFAPIATPAPGVVYNTTNVGKSRRQGQGRPYRRDLGPKPQDVVELEDARIQLLASCHRGVVSTVNAILRRLMPTAASPCADAAGLTGRRRRRDVIRSTAANSSAIRRPAAPDRCPRRGLDSRGGHHQPANNALYVFALPAIAFRDSFSL